MKPFVLFVTALWLAGCSVVSQDTGGACDNNRTYVESWQETWGEITYSLPWCWIVTSNTEQQLVLQDQDSEQLVEISTFQLEMVEGGIVEVIKTSPTGTPIYLYVTDPDNIDVQRIMDSLTWTTTETTTSLE